MPRFTITSQVTVTLEETWMIDADNADHARQLFDDESEGRNLTFVGDKSLEDERDRVVTEVQPTPAIEPLKNESLLGRGEAFFVFENPLQGFRIVRLSDGAEATFYGDDSCEEFRHNFHGDEFDSAEDNAEAADEVGRWAQDEGYL